jgi:hypothetical protein
VAHKDEQEGTVSEDVSVARSDDGVGGWGGISPVTEYSYDIARAFAYNPSGWHVDSGGAQCCWYLCVTATDGFQNSYSGTCAIPIHDTGFLYGFDAAQPLGWYYDWDPGVGSSISGFHSYQVWMTTLGEPLWGYYDSNYDDPFEQENWYPEYNEAQYYFVVEPPGDNETAELLDVTWTFEAQSSNIEVTPGTGINVFRDVNIELWERPYPSSGWFSTIGEIGVEPSTLQGSFLAGFGPGGGTHVIVKTAADYGMGGWPSPVAGLDTVIQFSLIPEVARNTNRPSHSFTSVEAQNYTEYHFAAGFKVTVTARWRSAPYIRYFIDEFDPEPASDEWAAALWSRASTEVVVCSPDAVEYRQAEPQAEYLMGYDIAQGFALVGYWSNDTLKKLQLSREGITTIATATDSYNIARYAKSVRSIPAGISVLHYGYGDIGLYDHDTLEGKGVNYSIDQGEYAFTHGFYGTEIIGVNGDLALNVTKIADDGYSIESRRTVASPAGEFNDDPNYWYETDVYVFDEYGIGFQVVSGVENWPTFGDITTQYVYMFDLNYNFFPGRIEVESYWGYLGVQAWPIRAKTGLALMAHTQPIQEYDYFQGLPYQRDQGLYRLSVAGLSTTACTLTSTFRTLMESADETMYPGWDGFTRHYGAGGGYAAQWGAGAGDGTVTYLNRGAVAGFDSDSGAGNTPLESGTTANQVGWFTGGVFSLGKEVPNLAGGPQEKRRKFWRPKTAWAGS